MTFVGGLVEVYARGLEVTMRMRLVYGVGCTRGLLEIYLRRYYVDVT